MAARSAIIYSVLIAVTWQRSEFPHYRHDYHLIPHAADLDSITFDKVIPSQNITAVLFMHYLTYGLKETEFVHFAESTLTQPSVLAATVGVVETGESNNWDLAVRFKIKMSDLPLVKLFVRGELVATMDAPMHCDNIREFITKHTGVWVGRVGTIEYLDELAKKFMGTNKVRERDQIVDLVRAYKANATEEEQIKSSTYYLGVLEEYMKRGQSFLGMEDGRLKKELARHKFHKPSQCGIRKRRNILNTFLKSRVHFPHDEL